MHDTLCFLTTGYGELFARGCSDPAWNLLRPHWWWWKIQFEAKNSHISVRQNWIMLLSADYCFP